MAEHDVSLKLPLVPLEGEADVIFSIKLDGKKFGILTITKDSLIWAPRGEASAGTLEVTWAAFDEWMRARNTVSS